MSQNKTMRKMSQGLLLLVAAVFVSVTYNNCGEVNVQEEDPLVYKLQDEAAIQLAANPVPGLCSDRENYSCIKYSFSDQHSDGVEDASFPCVILSSGEEICVGGRIVRHDSTRAKARCLDCSDEERESRYEYDDYVCINNKFEIEGAPPIQVEKASLEESLERVIELCNDITGGQ